MTLEEFMAYMDADTKKAFSSLTPEQQQILLDSANGKKQPEYSMSVQPQPASATTPAKVVSALATANKAKSTLSELMSGSPAATVGQTVKDGIVYDAATGEAVATAVPSSVSTWGLSDIGAAGNAILPTVGAATALDLFANKRHGGRGAAQGVASGAALGSWFGLPGAAIGAGVGGLAGYFGNFGDKDMWKTEQDRVAKLHDQGINFPDAVQLSAGRTPEELVAIENAKKAAGQYANPTFAQSRNESDLTAKDIWGYGAFGEAFGNDWMGTSEAAREAIANEALKQGLVREHHGTVDINLTPELKAYAEEQFKTPTAPTSQSSRSTSEEDDKKKRRTRPPVIAPKGPVSLADLMPQYEAPTVQPFYAPSISTTISNALRR